MEGEEREQGRGGRGMGGRYKGGWVIEEGEDGGEEWRTRGERQTGEVIEKGEKVIRKGKT